MNFKATFVMSHNSWWNNLSCLVIFTIERVGSRSQSGSSLLSCFHEVFLWLTLASPFASLSHSPRFLRPLGRSFCNSVMILKADVLNASSKVIVAVVVSLSFWRWLAILEIEVLNTSREIFRTKWGKIRGKLCWKASVEFYLFHVQDWDQDRQNVQEDQDTIKDDNAKWVAFLQIDQSGCKDNQEVLERMEHNKEAELSLLLAPVHPPDGEEWEGQPEGGDQVDQPLPHHALAKLGGT